MKLKAKDLPIEWELTLLDSITKRGSGHTPNKQHPTYWNGGIKWVSLSDSNQLDNGYIYKTDKEISEEGLKNSSAVLHPKGTVILSRDAGVGKSAVLAETMAVSQHFIAWQCDGKNQIHNWYLYYWLQYTKQEFERIAIGSTIKTIGLPYFKKLKIPYPTYIEQTKIANILSTWDKAIETVEKLIENSRAQKKALMQQLLTGKKRFVGFEGEWENKKLNDVYKVIDSLHQTPKFSNKGYPMVRVTDVKGGLLSLDNTVKVSPEVFTEYTKKYLPKNHDIIFSRVGSYGISSYVNSTVPFCLGQNIVIAESSDNADSKYIFNVLKSVFIKKQIERTVDGSSHKTVSLKIIRNLDIPLPSIQEQQKIASVLTNADKEIELLEQQLSDLKQEKKALMQQLLTGKRRVTVATTSETLC